MMTARLRSSHQDVNGNGAVSALTDALFLLRMFFQGGPSYACADAADIDDNGQTPGSFALIEAYPNPFNGQVRLKLEVPYNSSVEEVAIYDLQGRKVRTLANTRLTPGAHEFEWDARDDNQQELSSGVYLALLRANTFVKSMKLLYIK